MAGFNDGGNLVGSLLAARAFTPLGASLILAFGVAAGPWLIGTAVAHTIVYSVVALPRLGPAVYLAGIAGTLGAVGLSWWRSLPTSTTLALIGALAGAGLAAAGPSAVIWGALGRVLVGMVLALGGGTVSGLLIWHLIRQVLRHVGAQAPPVLRGLQAASAALVGMGYGGNDAEKSVALFAFAGAWSTAAGQRTMIAGHLPIPAWAIWAAVGTFVLGMTGGGLRVARTVGFRFYRVRSTDALATQLATGLTVLVAGRLGQPASATQTSTAALLASGAARRLSLPRWSIVGEMVLSWVITLPLAFAGGFVAGGLWRLLGGGIG